MLNPHGLSRSFNLNISPECHAKRGRLAKRHNRNKFQWRILSISFV
jgi:hypothetical protein